VCECETATEAFGEKATYDWLRCRACGTLFVERFPTVAELQAVYGSYYHADNLKLPDLVRRRSEEILAPFTRYRQTGRLLDVGYGAGYLLNAAEHLGWECWGQEVSPEPIRIARERGWHVLEGDFDHVEIPEAHFDVICITGVLEHIEYPLRYLRHAWRALRPGGLLYATTPNGLSMTSRVLGVKWSVCMPPEHVQLFSHRSLVRACQRVGFTHSRIRCEGINPYEIWGQSKDTPVDRVGTAQALNERLSSGVLPRLMKRTANGILSASGLGDELKYTGEKEKR
jgi:SAM-dependent methyltransferase